MDNAQYDELISRLNTLQAAIDKLYEFLHYGKNVQFDPPDELDPGLLHQIELVQRDE